MPASARRTRCSSRHSKSTAVGKRPAGATPQGVHDLAGKVAEWTSSLYRQYPYRAGDGREDHVLDTSPEKWRASFGAGFARAVMVGHRHIGFRCAR